MRVLFDQGVPAPLRHELRGHAVDTTFERGWSHLGNGEPLDAAEADGYEVFLTTDQNIRHQQNLSGRRIAIVVLLSTAWPRICARIPQVVSTVDSAQPGAFIEVSV